MRKKRIVMGIAIGVPLLVVAGTAFIVVSSYLEHRKLVEAEKEAYPPPGMLVEIEPDADRLHVYAEGEREDGPTMVFLSGLGTSSPYYDFKVLFEQFSPDYRVAVVERAGYGWSDITASSRDIDTVLEETRTALELAGESPPYVLFPHSMAGLEALYWGANHPDEVAAVIGLDPLVPEYHQRGDSEASLSPLVTILARTGLMRSGPDIFASNFPAMVHGHLTDREAEVAKTVFLRRTNTSNMLAEEDALAQNAQRVLEQGPPDVPVHVFISNQGTPVWKESLVSYAEAIGGEYFLLDAEHYVHQDKPEFIAKKSRELLASAGLN
ncbi:MAG: alpha/beta fold hydrolase [Spirochaetota bacterium]